MKTSHGTVVNDYHFAPYRDLPLARAKIVRKVENRDGRWTVTLTADAPAFFVWANVKGMKGEFSDNSFTLLPGRPRTLSFVTKNKVSPQTFCERLTLRHLFENPITNKNKDSTQ